MQRVPLENRAQKDKFGPGKHGYQGGNPTTGVLATIPGAEAFDCFQEEIANVIENAGIQLDGKNYQQLYQAIVQLITDGGRLPVAGCYSTSKKYLPGTLLFLDGEWYECYHPNGCKGKDPRDPINRPAGWQNTDQSQPYYWLKIGRWLSIPETGSPIYLPTTAIREGLIKYRNDGNLHKDKFWRLAELYPNLISNNFINIADLRGEFLRGFDDGRGVDSNRKINSWQRHQILNHVHGIQGWTGDSSMLVPRNGSLNKLGGVSVTKGDGGIIYSDKTGFQVDPSWRMISTDNISNRAEEVGAEVRPRNVAMLIATRI